MRNKLRVCSLFFDILRDANNEDVCEFADFFEQLERKTKIQIVHGIVWVLFDRVNFCNIVNDDHFVSISNRVNDNQFSIV